MILDNYFYFQILVTDIYQNRLTKILIKSLFVNGFSNFKRLWKAKNETKGLFSIYQRGEGGEDLKGGSLKF